MSSYGCNTKPVNLFYFIILMNEVSKESLKIIKNLNLKSENNA